MKVYSKATRTVLIITAIWVTLLLDKVLEKKPDPIGDVLFNGFYAWIALIFFAIWLSHSMAAIKERNTLAIILIGMSSVASGLIAIEYWGTMASGANPRWLTITPIAVLFGFTAFVAKTIEIFVSKTTKWIKR